MKFRNIALYVIPLVLVGALVYIWSRSKDTETPQVETADYEERESSIEKRSPEIDEVAPKPESVSLPYSRDSILVPLRNSFGDPIPFESVVISEVEEMSLTNGDDQHSHKIREWRGRIEPSLPKIKELLEAEGEDGVLAISLPDASQVKVTGMRFESFGPNQGVITGKILGDAFGEVVLSYVNQAVAGSIRDYRNDMVWEVRNAGEGRQYIAQVDVEALGVCGVCAVHGDE